MELGSVLAAGSGAPGTLSGARGMMVLGLGMIESVLVLVAVFLMTKM
jgi:hypothetical protein